MNKAPLSSLLTVNGGSSSIKFALFDTAHDLRRITAGKLEGIGLPQGRFLVKGTEGKEDFSRSVTLPDHTTAVALLMDWVQSQVETCGLQAVGHRVVHGGPKYWEPQQITPEMVSALHELSPFDPEHLPEEILLTEAFHRRFPKLPQVACFDTAFHHGMPRVARLLPLPRRYDAKGVQRYGFHGLSCEYLMEELERMAGARVAAGRILLAHLGNGASITAVREGRSLDTSMGFTPAAGLPMSTRSGDLDPGIAWYLSRAEQVTAKAFHHMINHEAGLLGVSETSSDMRTLLSREAEDTRAAEAVALFCYQAKKWLCALAGVLGGLDSVVFAGGIGENAPEVRARICSGLEFLGLKLDLTQNHSNAAVISSDDSAVTVRVIRTDEEWIIAKKVCRALNLSSGKET